MNWLWNIRININLAVLVSLFTTQPLPSQDISFLEHVVTSSFYRGREVYACDINDDGHMDILAGGDTDVCWWENDGNLVFTEHLISDNIAIARSVRAGDIDGDGDVDVVGAIISMDEIRWWRNDGQENFTEIILDTSLIGPHTVDLKDVNRDGHLDILCSGFDMSDAFSEICWFENDEQADFTKHLISERFQQSPFIYGGFINDDEHMDILACGEVNGEVVWWENDGAENFSENEHMIDDDYAFAHTVLAKDLDLDGDTDILGAACMSSQFTWWENDGDEYFQKHHIENLSGALWIDAVDLDRDGDRDLIGAGMGASNIAWWENDGFQNFTHRSIPGNLAEAYCVVYEDLDNDLDHDLVAIGYSSNKINWYENDLHRFGFGAEPISGHAPQRIQFTDLSIADPPVTSWAWDFDDDGIVDSYESEPSWIYESSGAYTVRLEVSSDSLSRILAYDDYIHVFDGESALLFNGRDNSASCAAAPDLNPTDRLAIEAWIKPEGWGEVANSGQGRILDKRYFALYLNGSGTQYMDHSLVFMLMNSSGAPKISCTPSNSIVLGEWQHVAVSYDASTSEVFLYIDGIIQPLTQNDTPSGSIRDNSQKDMIIGNSENEMYTFDGLIDEVRVWNTVRSGDEIASNLDHYLSGTEADLLAYWRMNEGYGSVLGDETAGQNDAVIVGSEWRQGILLDPVSSEPEYEIAHPGDITLHGCFPNPSNGDVEIRFHIPEASEMSIGIFDIGGRLIRTLIKGKINGGHRIVIWNGRDDRNRGVASGTYFCTIETAGFGETIEILHLK